MVLFINNKVGYFITCWIIVSFNFTKPNFNKRGQTLILILTMFTNEKIVEHWFLL